MFKRHVYTCPDVIHMRQVQQRNKLITYIVMKVGILLVLGAWGRAYSRKLQTAENTTSTPA